MGSTRWDVVAKLSLNYVCPQGIMLATGWFRMKSPAVKTHESPPAMHSMTQLKNPVFVMVMGCVTCSDGCVVSSHLIPAGLNINRVDDLMIQKMLWCRVLLRCKPNDVHPGPHESKTVQDFLLEKMSMFVLKNIWPSCSSNMYPCDFWLWGVFREKTNAAIHGIIDPLKTSIRKPLKSNMPEEARVTCAAFSGQFDRMKLVYWGYIEWNVTSGTHECTYKKSTRFLLNWRWYDTRKNDTEKSRFICPPQYVHSLKKSRFYGTACSYPS